MTRLPRIAESTMDFAEAIAAGEDTFEAASPISQCLKEVLDSGLNRGGRQGQ